MTRQGRTAHSMPDRGKPTGCKVANGRRQRRPNSQAPDPTTTPRPSNLDSVSKRCVPDEMSVSKRPVFSRVRAASSSHSAFPVCSRLGGPPPPLFLSRPLRLVACSLFRPAAPRFPPARREGKEREKNSVPSNGIGAAAASWSLSTVEPCLLRAVVTRHR